MTDGNELIDWLRLAATPGLGADRQRSLLAAFGLPRHIFAAGRNAIAGVVGGAAADALLAAPRQDWIERALAWADEAGSHILTLADEAYPRPLLDIADPPVVLYVKGDPALLQRPALAIVGARSATPQGESNAEAFARHLAAQGFAIVSGLASGIDAAAHAGALAAGRQAAGTVAVVGTGIDRIYPARNAALAREIAARGAIVSEFPLGTPPLQHNFPRRNRIIAGLAQGVLVVEAALNSGSLITARLAAETGREVFAIPGSIHSPLSRGCHRLIRDGAKLVETAEDVVEELRGRLGMQLPAAARPAGSTRRPRADSPPPAAQAHLALDTLDDDAARVLRAIGHDPVDLDTLAPRCGLTVDALYAILLPLELDGHVARLPGGRIQRT
ncbi:DNA-processing protein DprA [Thauera linaloolentis]|uniref:DNA protecting protein DprA n=1 Tax=Thauera linaloolentis (strain DSM 12138 / JCM 21573 / CCUG 41526 / CIP 105981 / IAM 15112 / NBRC 102519 / 47Lol) TaxID=1123367 RepID=N6Z3I5_THAL4|nr:DNA-processing protein DprA [Thauera linaloolentis]ENO89177.1 DNA protecting protein DprA [Thauera linaloolentis 47Lol = DSM 12138]MCM8567291.1 DNA-processing protein DprA [Thauera linaloolentis]